MKTPRRNIAEVTRSNSVPTCTRQGSHCKSYPVRSASVDNSPTITMMTISEPNTTVDPSLFSVVHDSSQPFQQPTNMIQDEMNAIRTVLNMPSVRLEALLDLAIEHAAGLSKTWSAPPKDCMEIGDLPVSWSRTNADAEHKLDLKDQLLKRVRSLEGKTDDCYMSASNIPKGALWSSAKEVNTQDDDDDDEVSMYHIETDVVLSRIRKAAISITDGDCSVDQLRMRLDEAV